jgi:hypothetical protein
VGSEKRVVGRAAGEFLIVVVGVAVALAADSWRQDWSDRGAEDEYLARLAKDLELGREQLAGSHNRVGRLLSASEALIATLDRPETADEVLIEEIQAVSISVCALTRRLDHNATYRELEATGRLMLIRDADLRQEIVSYYDDIAVLISLLAEVPTGLYDRFLQLTGYGPYAFRSETGCTSCVPLSADMRERLLREWRDTTEARRALRELHGRLAFIDGADGSFDRVSAKRNALAAAIR